MSLLVHIRLFKEDKTQNMQRDTRLGIFYLSKKRQGLLLELENLKDFPTRNFFYNSLRNVL